MLFNVGNQNTTEGTKNTAIGTATLLFNNTGNDNTAVGAASLSNNTSGVDNTASGADATGDDPYRQLQHGYRFTGALCQHHWHRKHGQWHIRPEWQYRRQLNTAIGAFALANNTGSESAPAVGVDVLFNNSAGGNTGIGSRALRLNQLDSKTQPWVTTRSIAIPAGAFLTRPSAQAALTVNTGGGNTACGNVALFFNTGSNNTALGNGAGANLTSGNNNIDIGYIVGGVAGESNTIRIGNSDINNTFISGISGTNSPGGVAVFCHSDGKLGVISSSVRFKEDIKPMGKASEAILALKPVSFRYKKEIDPQSIPEFGLIAEEVEKVNPDLIIRDKKGKPYTVRYEQINAMLLNEFLKEHRRAQEQAAAIGRLETTVAKQEETIAGLKKGMEILAAQFKEQATQIEKVNAQVKMSRFAKGRIRRSGPAQQIAMEQP